MGEMENVWYLTNWWSYFTEFLTHIARKFSDNLLKRKFPMMNSLNTMTNAAHENAMRRAPETNVVVFLPNVWNIILLFLCDALFHCRAYVKTFHCVAFAGRYWNFYQMFRVNGRNGKCLISDKLVKILHWISHTYCQKIQW